MKLVARKTTACGSSCEPLGVVGAIAALKQAAQMVQLLGIAEALRRENNLVAGGAWRVRVQLLEKQVCEGAEPRYGFVLTQRPANVVDLSAAIRALRIGQEQHAGHRQSFRRDIEQHAIGLTPDSMEFRLDEYLRPLPDSPAENALAAGVRHLPFDHRKAFVGGRFWQWCAWDIDGLGALHDAPAELEHIGFDEMRWAHQAMNASPRRHMADSMTALQSGIAAGVDDAIDKKTWNPRGATR